MVVLHVNVSRVAFTETEREYEALAKRPSQKNVIGKWESEKKKFAYNLKFHNIV